MNRAAGVVSRRDAVRCGRARGDEHHRRRVRLTRETLGNLEAVQIRELHVQENNRGLKACNRGDRRLAVRRLTDHREALRLEQRAGQRPERGVVVDDQNGRSHLNQCPMRQAAAPPCCHQDRRLKSGARADVREVDWSQHDPNVEQRS